MNKQYKELLEKIGKYFSKEELLAIFEIVRTATINTDVANELCWSKKDLLDFGEKVDALDI